MGRGPGVNGSKRAKTTPGGSLSAPSSPQDMQDDGTDLQLGSPLPVVQAQQVPLTQGSADKVKSTGLGSTSAGSDCSLDSDRSSSRLHHDQLKRDKVATPMDVTATDSSLLWTFEDGVSTPENLPTFLPSSHMANRRDF